MRQQLNTHRIRAFSDMGISMDASKGNRNTPKLAYEYTLEESNHTTSNIEWLLSSRFVSFSSLYTRFVVILYFSNQDEVLLRPLSASPQRRMRTKPPILFIFADWRIGKPVALVAPNKPNRGTGYSS